MKKRLRKKKHLGEFDCIGFSLEVTFNIGDGEFDALHDAFIDYIESINLCCGGGMGRNWSLFVNKWDDTVIKEEERVKVVEWLMKVGGTKINTHYESAWHCRPLTKSGLNKYGLPFTCLH